jgi:hypothetical protein
MHAVREKRRAILEHAFLEANAAINMACERLVGAAEEIVEFVQASSLDDYGCLNLLYAVWPLVPPPQRMRFLMEMLTPPERVAIQTGLLPDTEDA